MTDAAKPLQDPPHYDSDLEETVIAHLLARDSAVVEIEEHCKPADFGCETFAVIFEAVQFLKTEGMAVSPLVLKARLAGEIIREIERRAGIPALDYFQGLSRRASPRDKLSELAKAVADRAKRRRLDAELEAGRARLYDYSRPVTECVAGVTAAMGLAAESEARAAGYEPLPDAIDSMLKEAENAINGVKPPAIYTGLKGLDRITGGFHGGDMVVIAGRPGSGKTVMLGSVARVAAQAGAPVVIFELEMRTRSILHRLIADIDYDLRPWGEKPLAYSRMRSGSLRGAEFDRMFSASQSLRSLPIEIFDTPGMTIQEIGVHAQRTADKSKTLGLIVIDYLQIIQAGDRYRGSKYAEMTEVSNEIKRMAKRIGWPALVGCQLSREVEKREKDRRPHLSDLRDTGAIEQDADIVIGMHRPAYYVMQKRPVKTKEEALPEWEAWLADMNRVRNVLDLPILKNRGGPDGSVTCFVEIGASAIRDAKENDARQHEDDPGQGMTA